MQTLGFNSCLLFLVGYPEHDVLVPELLHITAFLSEQSILAESGSAHLLSVSHTALEWSLQAA